MGEGEEVLIVSKHNIRPSPRATSDSRSSTVHLTPWDLKMICMDYIQKGLLFHKPPPHHLTVSSLLSSFSVAIDLFFPLAGRLHATNSTESTLSISLQCTDEGAEFVHATALSVTVSDILTPYRIPRIVRSFFPLDGLLNYDGFHKPLLAAQVTELADGIFVAVSVNHCAVDGTSFWHFFNAWSTICRSGVINHTPDFRRWFPDSCPPPYPLPFGCVQDLVKTVELPPVEECFFPFSAESIRKMKSRANAEAGADRISSLQSLLAHVWRSVTRARGLKPEEDTSYTVVVGHRSKCALPQTYFGNTILGVSAKALAGEVVGEGLGHAAMLLNQVVASQTERAVREWFNSWVEKPSIRYLGELQPTDLVTGSSPRFDVFGNDFGWGRPLAVRSGRAAKMDGLVTVYPGSEPGSMGLEVCLSPKALGALLEDGEFMDAVS